MSYCKDPAFKFSQDVASRSQKLLSSKLLLEDRLDSLRVVAGLDVSYARLGDVELGVGVVSLVEWSNMKPISSFYTIKPICVPYIPGLLAFREMEVLAPLVSRVVDEVDLIVVDGHGIAHPRYFGIASHIGLAFDKPSVGVAKHKLVGVVTVDSGRKVVIHGGRIVAEVVESGGRELYVSPGHRVSLETAVALVSRMILRPGELPEPTRLADVISKKIKAEILKKQRLDSALYGRVFELKPLY
ncbi:MAG: endonuclease V [Acidilobaceae archaeon]